VSRSSYFKDERTGKMYRSQSTQTKRAILREIGVQSPPLEVSPPPLKPIARPQLSGQLPRAISGTIAELSAQRADFVNTPTVEEPRSLMQSTEGQRAIVGDRTAAQRPRAAVLRMTPVEAAAPTASPQSQSLPSSQETIPTQISQDTLASRDSAPIASPPQSPSPPGSIASSLSSRQLRRRWDPARGVDVFKQQSEEVLARFLSMGSWERS